MTTSRETNDLNHPVLRGPADAANAMPVANRITLRKALVPGVAREMKPRDFEGLVLVLRLKGERFYDAVKHAPARTNIRGGNRTAPEAT